MTNDSMVTINSPIYRDISELLNKTLFEVYVHESYHPVVHGAYLDNPNLIPINAPATFEEDNYCYAKYPLTYIIDMLVNEHEFAWKYPSDAGKAAGFLKVYIDQFENVPLDKFPEQKAFLEKTKKAYSVFWEHKKDHDKHGEVEKPKKLTLLERLKYLGF